MKDNNLTYSSLLFFAILVIGAMITSFKTPNYDISNASSLDSLSTKIYTNESISFDVEEINSFVPEVLKAKKKKTFKVKKIIVVQGGC